MAGDKATDPLVAGLGRHARHARRPRAEAATPEVSMAKVSSIAGAAQRYRRANAPRLA
jgi:hypothetical protein